MTLFASARPMDEEARRRFTASSRCPWASAAATSGGIDGIGFVTEAIMHSKRIAIALVAGLGACTPAAAECMARHKVTGELVRAKEVDAPKLNYWATATFPNGYPTITYGPEFYRLAPIVQEFSKLHECAHLSIPSSDETRVNCLALTTMREKGLSEKDEAAIEQAHTQYARLDDVYGGSGREYWRRTIACAGPRKVVLPVDPCPREMNMRYTEALKRDRATPPKGLSGAAAVREEAKLAQCELRLTIIK